MAWLLLFAALAVLSPERRAIEWELLLGLGLLQVVEPRWAGSGTRRGQTLAIAAKLLLAFLVIGYTGGIASSYFLLLLLPVVSAATTLGLLGTAVFTGLSGAAYALFALPYFLDPGGYTIGPEGAREVALRLLFLVLVAFLTHQLAAERREAADRHARAAAELAEANRHLQAAEAAVRRADRLAALGQLTAGLAHELRNPLGTLRGAAELLARQVPAGGTAGELAGIVASEVDRADTLVSRFLDFARPLRPQRQMERPATVLDRAVERLEAQQPAPAVTVLRNYSPDVRPFAFDAALVESAVHNLLRNAAQASPSGGVVTLKLRPAGDGVEIAVIDRGPGIAPEHRESIFNPFFTTRPEGVGLGLAIVAKIVAEHGGTVAVDSAPGEGSVFRIWLPS